MSDGSIEDTARRFEIFVPSPKARINMGSRNATDTGPFGYSGLSLQSDVHLFIDANKHTLYQTGQNFCGQVGGKWWQFSNDPMFLSSTANMTVAADNKVIIASGAGQGQITALDHGENIRLVPYNELKLHYVVDTLQTGLFEFFHGRHDRKEEKFGLLKKIDLEHFDSSSAALKNDGVAAHEGGFLNTVARSWELMDRGVLEDALAANPAHGAVPSLGPILGAKIAGAPDLAALEYGFSTYFARFDPYKYGKDGWLNKLHKVVSVLKRFVHVALKYGEIVTDLPIISHAIKAFEALGSLMNAAWSARNMATDSFPALVTFQRASDGSWSGGSFGTGGVVDEASSGMLARGAHVADGAADSRKAKIESKEEPDGGFRLTGQTYRLDVEWKDGRKSPVVMVNPTGPQPATLQITAPTLTNTPETKTLALKVGGQTITVSLSAANTADGAVFAAAIDAALGARGTAIDAGASVAVTATPHVAIGGAAGAETASIAFPPSDISVDWSASVDVNGTVTTVTVPVGQLVSAARFAESVRGQLPESVTVETAVSEVTIIAPEPALKLLNANDTPSLLVRMGSGEAAYDNRTSSLPLKAPVLSATGEKEQLKVAVDGTTFTVDLDSSTTLKSALDAETTLLTLASVSGTGNGPITITTRSSRGSSQVAVKSVYDQPRWSFSPSRDEQGADGCDNPLTVDALLGLIGSLDGVSASKDGSKLVLEATATGEGSKVKVSGNLAGVVFTDKEDEITGAPDLGDSGVFDTDFETSLKTLRSWNHELQKLPEDTRNLTRPLTNALQDTLSTVSALESMTKTIAEIAAKGSPPPPEAIGLLANDGITLGTADRIVGTGGKGIVFISDGGTGSPDRNKFVKTEKLVADMGAWTSSFFEADSADAPARSLGFRVLSDSAIDMTSTTYAQLAAMGRAKLQGARPDGRQDGAGIGIARVIGSYASEVAGYEKVVISARSPGDANDQAGATGGRVELLGQRLTLGGVTDEHTLGNGVKLSLTDRGQMGTQPLLVDGTPAGAEHLEDGEDSDVAWAERPNEDAAWSTELRDAHPSTSHVDLHATTEIETVVLPYRMRLSKEGVKVGVVTPKETDRRDQLQADVDRFTDIKDERQQALTECVSRLAARTAKQQRLTLLRDNPMNALRAPRFDFHIQRIQAEIDELEERQEDLTRQLQRATAQVIAAQAALSAFSATWDTKAFPVLELTEDTIRLGFANGSQDWKDFAYLEITKDGIKMFQPKANGTATFDLAAKTGAVTDGAGKASFTANDGKLNLKFQSDMSAGAIKVDAQGNVKLG